MTPRTVIIAALAAAVSASGCADPYAGERPRRVAMVPGEVPAPPVSPPAERLGALPASPEAAARRAADLTTTWTSANVARQFAEFATFATGAARRRAEEAAARLPTDPQLDGARSRGRVVAVVMTARGGDERDLLVVTHESVRADGLVDQRWRVTLASVQRRRRGWAITRWDPQP